MYDINWTRRVYSDYVMLHPRVEQIDRILVQLHEESSVQNWLTRIDIINTLLHSIQGKVSPKIWRAYKKLIKNHIFNVVEAKNLLLMIEAVGYLAREERLQSVFLF